jgi:hypothetical protein
LPDWTAAPNFVAPKAAEIESPVSIEQGASNAVRSEFFKPLDGELLGAGDGSTEVTPPMVSDLTALAQPVRTKSTIAAATTALQGESEGRPITSAHSLPRR